MWGVQFWGGGGGDIRAFRPKCADLSREIPICADVGGTLLGGGDVCANLFFTVEIRAFRPKCADVGGTLLGGGDIRANCPISVATCLERGALLDSLPASVKCCFWPLLAEQGCRQDGAARCLFIMGWSKVGSLRGFWLFETKVQGQIQYGKVSKILFFGGGGETKYCKSLPGSVSPLWPWECRRFLGFWVFPRSWFEFEFFHSWSSGKIWEEGGLWLFQTTFCTILGEKMAYSHLEKLGQLLFG